MTNIWPVNTIQNKYFRWYENIISRSQNRTFTENEYTENHHIIPRSLGGSNKKINLACLTAREHYICHRLLTKFLTGEGKRKMAFAMWIMVTNNNPHQQRHKINSRTYEFIKRELVAAQKSPEFREKVKEGLRKSEKQKNKIIWNKGVPVTEEMKQRLRDANLGKTVAEESITKGIETKRNNGTLRTKGSWSPSPETREKLRQARLGKTTSEDVKRKISEANKGRKMTSEQKIAISKRMKGQTLPESHVESIRQAQRTRREREAYERSLLPQPEVIEIPLTVEYRGKWYKNMNQVAKEYGVSRGVVERQIRTFGPSPTPEICQKIDDGTIERVRSPTSDDTKAKISKAQIGRIFSEETRQKMSEKAKGRTPWNKGKSISKEATVEPSDKD